MQKTARNDNSVIVINGKRIERNNFVKSLTAERLYENAPGMSERKEVELFTKWRPHLPFWARDITCPRPSDEVMARVKAGIFKKRQAREEKKKEKSAPSNKQKSTQNKKDTKSTETKKKKVVKKKQEPSSKHKIQKKSKSKNKVNTKK